MSDKRNAQRVAWSHPSLNGRTRLRQVLVVACLTCFLAFGMALGPKRALARGTNTTSVTDIANPDAYTCGQPGFVGFESLPDGTNLPGTISGLSFVTTGGNPWIVGDFSTGNYNGKYPNGGYTSEGSHWAWLGPNQGSGRIDFTNGNASYFSLLTSVAASPVYVVAYDSNNNVVATAGPAPNDYATGHMTELKITRAVPDMAYVIVHDTGNFFLADSLCTDAPGVVEALPPPIIDVNAFNGFAGVDADLQATIIEPVSNVLASDYAVTVNWGDGTSDSSGVGINPPGTRSDGEPLCPSGDTCRLLTDIHTYSAPGSYVVTVTVARTAGGQTVSAQGQGIATIVTSNATATIRSVGLLTFSEVGQTDVYSGQPIVSGCTATVVDSPSGNVILTAKHCLGETFGDVANLEFAPFHRPNNPCWNDIAAAHPYQVQVAECGGNPFGVWYAQPIDITKGAGDYAFVVVHPSPGEPSVEQAAGGVPVVFDLNGQPDPEQSQGWNFYMYPADQLNFAMKHQFRLLTCAGNPAGTPATSELQIESNCGYPPKLCATATRPCPFGGSGGPWVNTSNGIYTNNGGPLITGIGAVLKANVPEFGACNGCYGSVGTILGYDAMKTYERAALHGS